MDFRWKNYLWILVLIFTVSCGKKINSSSAKNAFSTTDSSYLLIEKQCGGQAPTQGETAKSITEFYNDYMLKNSQTFVNIPMRFYDYKSPLVVNLSDLKLELRDLQAKAQNPEYLQANATNLAIDIFYLYQKAMRFEGVKCSFPSLVTKKSKDIRPFLELNDFCQEKNGNAECSPTKIDQMTTKADIDFIEEKTLSLCEAFNNNSVDCQAQLGLRKQNKDLGKLVALYQKRYREEKYSRLFTLRDSHLKFSCQKTEALTEMKVKVSTSGWNRELLTSLISSVEAAWSRNSFKLSIALVDERGANVVEIIPVQGGISYVPDNNNTQVYLSQKLNLEIMKRTLVHEFGHVLGFPDCYTEFFDHKKKDLIYYEISSDNTNIMCSLKSGVSVPDDYLDQLSQKSCLFN